MVFLLVFVMAFTEPTPAGEKAPPIEGRDLASGEPVSLDRLRGKVVFVDFWASWCPPCVASLPAWERMRQEIDHPDFAVIAVNVDEYTADGLRFLEAHPVGYPVIADPEGKIGIPWNIRSLPRYYLVDREGAIVKSWKRFRPGDENKVRQRVEALLQRQ